MKMQPAHDGWAQTRDINLASALASFTEVEVWPEEPVSPFHDHDSGESYSVFRFKSSEKVKEVMRLWFDDKLFENHPEHPVAYMKAFTHNRSRYLDAIKSRHVWHIAKKGQKTYFIQKERGKE